MTNGRDSPSAAAMQTIRRRRRSSMDTLGSTMTSDRTWMKLRTFDPLLSSPNGLQQRQPPGTPHGTTPG